MIFVLLSMILKGKLSDNLFVVKQIENNSQLLYEQFQ